MTPPLICIEGLSKRFPRTSGYRDILTFWRREHIVALHRIDLEVPEGSVFGILGPNGAGKTTLLKILAGLVTPDSGRVLIDGYDISQDPDDVKDYLTYVSGEERTLYWRLTGRQNLRFFAMLNGMPKKQQEARVSEVLSVVGLEDRADERVVKYSTGMRQRLSIARGLLPDPDILLLDEPTRSLDPLSARRLQEFIRNELIHRRGKTVLLATHNMDEATYLCDRAAIIHQGRVKVCDTVRAISEHLGGQGRLTIKALHMTEAVASSIRNLDGVMSANLVSANGSGEAHMEVAVRDPVYDVPTVVDHLVSSGCRVLEVVRSTPSLSDAIASLAETPDDNEAVRVPVARLGTGS